MDSLASGSSPETELPERQILSGPEPRALVSAALGLWWWAYKQGMREAEDKAKIEALERGLVEVRAELANRRTRRWRLW